MIKRIQWYLAARWLKITWSMRRSRAEAKVKAPERLLELLRDPALRLRSFDDS